MRKITLPPRTRKRRETTVQWFSRWIEIHKRLNPHQGFANYETTTNGVSPYDGWVRAFEVHGVTARDALEMSQTMQASPKPEGGMWPEHHLPSLLEIHRRRQARLGESATDDHRRRRAAEAVAFQADQARERADWDAAPAEVRERITSDVQAEHPHLVRWPRIVEAHAIERWNEVQQTR